jgi:hypothetical protein
MALELRPVEPINVPLDVRWIEGEVVIIGGAVAFSMTAAAARETCRRLGTVLDEVGDTSG